MTEQPQMLSDKYIHIIVDGEVTGFIPVPALMGESSQEMMIAAFMSEPIFVITEEKYQRGTIWDGEKFTTPVE